MNGVDYSAAARLFAYDPETGVLTRRIDCGGQPAGSAAGCRAGGYLSVMCAGRLYRVHRLAWLLAYGRWPEGVVDHINGNGLDNRLCNLRDVTQAENMLNQHRRSPGATGLRGVDQLPGGRFRARVRFRGKTLTIGTFDHAQDAFNAAKAKRLEWGAST